MSLALALAASLAALAAPGSEPLVEQKLGNGVRLAVLEVKDAPKQTFFAFLPLGLAYDDAHRAQWSHLLEHMLIRTTDAEGLQDGAIVFNGETSDASLRLDVHAPPKEAARAAAKLCSWLTGRDFEPEVLEREKKSVAAEIASTAPRGFTHKWATAAWTQVVRHGAKEAAVQGDVTAATSDDLEDYADSKLALGPSIRIVAVGPLSSADAKSLFETQFSRSGGLDALANALGAASDAQRRKASAAPAAPTGPLAHGELAATWDLPATHLLEWYLLPDATPADRASASLFANLLSMKLQADAELGKAKIVALATADVALPEGRVLFLTASLPDAAAKETAAKAFRRAIDTLDATPQGGSLEQFLVMARNELSGLPDFPALRKQWAGRPNADLVEAQIALSIAAREGATRLTFGELGAATRALTVKDLGERRTRLLDAKLASRLLLTPRS